MSIIAVAGILCFLVAIFGGAIISRKLSIHRLKSLSEKDLTKMVDDAKKVKKICLFIIVSLLLVGPIPVVIISNVHFREMYMAILLLTMIFSVTGIIYSIRTTSVMKQITASKD